MQFFKLIATSLGIGYIGKGAGTVAAIACCVCWYFAWAGGYPPVIAAVIITAAITFTGVWAGNMVEPLWGKDHQRVVIDEVAGMCISLLLIPVNLKYTLCALILFRFFDITKPLLIRRLEKLPGGWGVMADDVLAGIYANILLHIIVIFKLLGA